MYIDEYLYTNQYCTYCQMTYRLPKKRLYNGNYISLAKKILRSGIDISHALTLEQQVLYARAHSIIEAWNKESQKICNIHSYIVHHNHIVAPIVMDRAYISTIDSTYDIYVAFINRLSLIAGIDIALPVSKLYFFSFKEKKLTLYNRYGKRNCKKKRCHNTHCVAKLLTQPCPSNDWL